MQLRLDEEDDPQIIFETLNARGAPLTPSDLIRNFVFLRAARNQEDVDALYDTHWRGFDEKPDEAAVAKGAKFWRKEERQGRLKSSRLDLLMYHYTTLRRVETLKVAHVFEEFKEWIDERMRQKMQEAAKKHAGSSTGIVDFAKYRRARTVRIGRNGTSQMMSPSGQDNYGEYAPLARREMI